MENIPEQYTGAHSDTSSCKRFFDEREAMQSLHFIKDKLLNINQWETYAGKHLAEFTLYGGNKMPSIVPPAEGDYIRIKIPGPGNPSGDGYDWVRIINIINEPDILSITVQPTASPFNDSSEVAHFFKDIATSTFLVKRIGSLIYAEVHGRNEEANVSDVSLGAKARNMLVAAGGMVGFSKIQWKNLTDGLLK